MPTTIIGVSSSGKTVQFQADAQLVESDVATSAGVTGGITCTSISDSGTLSVTGASTLAAVTASGLVTAGTLKLDTGTKTATATSGAATLAKASGVVTSESLTTAAGATYTLTITGTGVFAATQIPFATVFNGSNSAGTPTIATVTPASNTLTIVVQNIHASAAFNGTLKIAYGVLTA